MKLNINFEELDSTGKDIIYNQIYVYFKNTTEPFSEIDIDWDKKTIKVLGDEPEAEETYELEEILNIINQ